MTIEVICIWTLGLFTLLAWLPWSVAKRRAYGTEWLLSNREPPEGKELPHWGRRAERAYRNLQDFFPVFLTAIVCLLFFGKSNLITQVACTTFVSCRLLHLWVYIMGWPAIRATVWFVSIFALLALYGQIFVWTVSKGLS